MWIRVRYYDVSHVVLNTHDIVHNTAPRNIHYTTRLIYTYITHSTFIYYTRAIHVYIIMLFMTDWKADEYEWLHNIIATGLGAAWVVIEWQNGKLRKLSHPWHGP